MTDAASSFDSKAAWSNAMGSPAAIALSCQRRQSPPARLAVARFGHIVLDAALDQPAHDGAIMHPVGEPEPRPRIARVRARHKGHGLSVVARR